MALSAPIYHLLRKWIISLYLPSENSILVFILTPIKISFSHFFTETWQIDDKEGDLSHMTDICC